MIKYDRLGKESYNNFGSKIIITKYNNKRDIDIYFPEYNWTIKNRQYDSFKTGTVKCPYEPRAWGHGYLGEGKYTFFKDKKPTKCYETWNNMLSRCFNDKRKETFPTYKNCIISDEWLNYQNFAKWFEENYYEIDGDYMCLDKDILIKNNKIYSEDTCLIVPNFINVMFTNHKLARGKYPVGVTYHKRDKIYEAKINKFGKSIYLGRFDNEIDAFYSYKKEKEKYIKEVAELYKDKIPLKLYNAMYDYKVEITD